MGVAVALGVGGLAAGVLGGVLGGMGEQAQAEAQYLANKIEVERNNFKNNLANDKKNYAAARANAQRQWNNKQIAKSSVRSLSDTRKYNRDVFKANIEGLAKQQSSYISGLEARAVGKNLRGGLADRMKQSANNKFKVERDNLYKSRFIADTNAKAQFESSLAQRDMASYESASLYLPGSTGVKPGSGTLNMIAGIIGGGAAGLSAGMGAASAGNQMGWSGF